MTVSPETDYWYPDPDEPDDVQNAKKATAKAICTSCPVREECLIFAIEGREMYGIWGGKTPRERAVIRRNWEAEGQQSSPN